MTHLPEIGDCIVSNLPKSIKVDSDHFINIYGYSNIKLFHREEKRNREFFGNNTGGVLIRLHSNC
jgi:hypothetical protein